MASPKSKRRSRKRRTPGAVSRPRPVAAPRRELRAERQVLAERDGRRQNSMLGTYGERPANMFGGVPVSEIAIFFGGLGALVGLASGAAPALVVGIIVCALGVVEFTAREHFSGYRSHATLLAAIPAVGIGVALIALVGGSLARGTLLLVVVPVFGVLFWLLRNRFRSARQARVVRPPVP
ncbi:MAG TPA: hypothetical protein VMP89_14645 [Solirubrobacteraceae bacterium]|nr:hypothetical protein [Solirubrobacteraceae bacterium]